VQEAPKAAEVEDLSPLHGEEAKLSDSCMFAASKYHHALSVVLVSQTRSDWCKELTHEMRGVSMHQNKGEKGTTTKCFDV
jgi:hypothetical protein